MTLSEQIAQIVQEIRTRALLNDPLNLRDEQMLNWANRLAALQSQIPQQSHLTPCDRAIVDAFKAVFPPQNVPPPPPVPGSILPAPRPPSKVRDRLLADIERYRRGEFGQMELAARIDAVLEEVGD